MKLYLQIFYIVSLAIVAVNAYAQKESKSFFNPPNTFDSVWLWQVDTPNRLLYIAGERHDHALSSQEAISHELATTAYELSSRVLTESINNKWSGKDQLKSRLTPSTWVALDSAIRKSVASKLATKKDLATEQRNASIDDVVEVINRMQDGMLFLTLPGMLQPTPEKESQQRVENGYLKKITIEKYENKTGKQSALETSDAPNSLWLKNCGQPSDTESLIREILIETGPNAQKTEHRIQEDVNEFRSINATTESMTQQVINSVYWKTLNKCTVHPRNLEWIKKIKNELSNDKQPLMIVVGIAHVVGDTGLLSLLCKEGYCHSKRVLLRDLVKKQ